jgi:hypothetical protein
MNIGATSAEDDELFLAQCFVETSDLEALLSSDSQRSVVVGRTGSGKSALLKYIEDNRPNVIRLDPESLALNFISNSNIIQVFEKLDIKLDVFYQLLWRHVLSVELIKTKKNLHDEQVSRNWFASILSQLRRDQKKEKALRYLFEYGESFWADTEERVREVVRNIEDKFAAETGIDLNAWVAKIKSQLQSGRTESISETTEIIQKAERVVNSVQIQELNEVMNLLAEDIFDSGRDRFFIIIDDLDRDWAHDSIRFKLIRALIETIRKFRRITTLKIVVSLRYDLLQTVLDRTAQTGFQLEKYEDLFLRIRWSRANLKELVEKRLNLLFKKQYTGGKVAFGDIVSERISQQDSFEWILERTLERPRDLIAFFNVCFEQATGQAILSQKALRNAELEYSRRRLRYLADEWREVYGDLEPAIRILGGLKPRFLGKDVNGALIDTLCISVLQEDNTGEAKVAFSAHCNMLLQSQTSAASVREELLKALYIIGSIGVRSQNGAPFEWSYRNQPVLDSHLIQPETEFAIHPMLHRALNVYADPKRIV